MIYSTLERRYLFKKNNIRTVFFSLKFKFEEQVFLFRLSGTEYKLTLKDVYTQFVYSREKHFKHQ